MARGSHDAGPTDPTGGMSMMEPFEAVKHAQVKIAQLSADTRRSGARLTRCGRS